MGRYVICGALGMPPCFELELLRPLMQNLSRLCHKMFCSAPCNSVVRILFFQPTQSHPFLATTSSLTEKLTFSSLFVHNLSSLSRTQHVSTHSKVLFFVFTTFQGSSTLTMAPSTTSSTNNKDNGTRRRLSGSSTDSSDNNSSKKREECRHIETLFAQNLVQTSVHGDNFYLPASIIYDGSNTCTDKRSYGWSKQSGN